MKLYLETTVPSFLFADDAPEKQQVTRQFFKWLAISPDKLYISELVLAELNRASPDVRNKLLEAVVRLPVENLSITDEAVDLAGRYVRDGVIPARYRDDAVHVALAVLNNLDVVVTWNIEASGKRATDRRNQPDKSGYAPSADPHPHARGGD